MALYKVSCKYHQIGVAGNKYIATCDKENNDCEDCSDYEVNP